MSGNFVKQKIEGAGVPLAEVARNMNITPQSLNERLNVNDIKVGVLTDIARALGKNIYYFFDDSADVKENRFSTQKARNTTRPVEKSGPDESLLQLLRAKDDIIAAQQKTIQAYERMLENRPN